MTVSHARLFCLALLSAAGIVSAQSTGGKQPTLQSFTADSIRSLRIEVRSGDVSIRGGIPGRVSVRGPDGSAQLQDGVEVDWETDDGAAELDVSGGPRNGFGLLIEVPRDIDLEVRMPAGELDVSGVTGSKTVYVRAGEVTIEMGNPDNYGRVKAFVLTGEIRAPALQVNTGGIWRSVSRTGPGQHELRARLWAGELNLTN